VEVKIEVISVLGELVCVETNSLDFEQELSVKVKMNKATTIQRDIFE
jgi:hypothetical protein